MQILTWIKLLYSLSLSLGIFTFRDKGHMETNLFIFRQRVDFTIQLDCTFLYLPRTSTENPRVQVSKLRSA